MKINLYGRWEEELLFLAGMFGEKAIDCWKGFERWIKQTSGMGKRAHQMKEEHSIRDKNGSRAGT